MQFFKKLRKWYIIKLQILQHYAADHFTKSLGNQLFNRHTDTIRGRPFPQYYIPRSQLGISQGSCPKTKGKTPP
jgi:hypothetical protein